MAIVAVAAAVVAVAAAGVVVAAVAAGVIVGGLAGIAVSYCWCCYYCSCW